MAQLISYQEMYFLQLNYLGRSEAVQPEITALSPQSGELQKKIFCCLLFNPNSETDGLVRRTVFYAVVTAGVGA